MYTYSLVIKLHPYLSAIGYLGGGVCWTLLRVHLSLEMMDSPSFQVRWPRQMTEIIDYIEDFSWDRPLGPPVRVYFLLKNTIRSIDFIDLLMILGRGTSRFDQIWGGDPPKVRKYDEKDPYNPLYSPSQPYITPIILLSGPVLNANRQNWEWKKGIIVGIWCSYSYFFMVFHEKTAL